MQKVVLVNLVWRRKEMQEKGHKVPSDTIYHLQQETEAYYSNLINLF